MLRRALVALGVAALVAAVLRVRGSGVVPPQDGGWRWIECEGQCRRTGRSGSNAQALDQMSMAAVHAVKVADGQIRPSIPLGHGRESYL